MKDCIENPTVYGFKGFKAAPDQRFKTYIGNNKYKFTTHLVWVKHYGEIPQGLQINHKCNNKSCINIEHLYAGTQADNMKDRVKAGTTNKNIVLGERKHRPWIYFQFETKIHDEIRELYATGKFTYPQLSELYNVSVFTITKLCKGKA